MGIIDLLRNPWFVRIILIFWLLSTVLVAYLLGVIDFIVNHYTYTYGQLHFDPRWAFPYWNALRLVYIFLAIPAVFGGLILIAGFVKTDDKHRTVKRVREKASPQLQTEREHSVLIKCTHCGKVFSKPETMLDFSNGKPQLANVCPYCEHVLGRPEEESPGESIKGELMEEEVEAE